MSENCSEPDHPESERELEALLKNLRPNPLEFEMLRGLEADCDTVFEELPAAPGEMSPKWQRLIPLALVGALGMLAYASFHYGPRLNIDRSALAAKPAVPDGVPAKSSVAAGAPAMMESPEAGQFQPVSAQGFLINSSSEGLIETEEGLQEKMNLEYRDAYHWHDSETGTSIRYFQPRSEEIIIPLHTD